MNGNNHNNSENAEYLAHKYLDVAGVIIVVIGSDQNVRLINKKGTEVLGYSENEIVGRNWFDTFIPERMRLKVKDVFNKLISGNVEISEYAENPVLTKQGQERLIVWHNIVLRDDDGNIISTLSSGEDVTEGRDKDRELRFMKFAVDNAAASVFLVDKDANFIYVNEMACRKLGYSRQELISLGVFGIDPGMTSQRWAEHWNEIKQKGSFSFETFHRAKTGNIFPVEIAVNYLKYEDKEYNYAFVVDITERKRISESLESLNRELAQANKKLKRMILQDPLTGLYNHHYLQEVLTAELSRARRYATAFSLIMIDIDYFKSVNDSYGHQCGDLVLKQFAEQIKRMVRKYDTVVRSGGEEFIIISPGMDLFNALNMAQRVSDAIGLYNFGTKRQSVKLKLSVAAVSYPENRISQPMDLFELAERIIDKIKEHGGNRVYSLADLSDARSAAKKVKIAGDVASLKNKIEKLTKRSNETLKEAIFALARTIESKDRTTGEHVERTVRYATEIARGLGLSNDEIERIKQGCVLHDLGKVGVSEAILSKKGKLTEAEFSEIKKHPQTGANILRPMKFMHDVIPLVLYHHERWDGRGYPVGLKGEDIPIGARIISVADVYQALTANRPYRKALPKKKAIEIIKKGSGTQFDPVVVNQFLEIIQKKK